MTADSTALIQDDRCQIRTDEGTCWNHDTWLLTDGACPMPLLRELVKQANGSLSSES